jgi:hypothetical protein
VLGTRITPVRIPDGTRCPLHLAPHHHPGGVDGSPERHRSLARHAGTPRQRRRAGCRLARRAPPARAPCRRRRGGSGASRRQPAARCLAALEAYPPLWAFMLGFALRGELPLDDDEAERPPSVVTAAALARLTALPDEPRPSTPGVDSACGSVNDPAPAVPGIMLRCDGTPSPAGTPKHLVARCPDSGGSDAEEKNGEWHEAHVARSMLACRRCATEARLHGQRWCRQCLTQYARMRRVRLRRAPPEAVPAPLPPGVGRCEWCRLPFRERRRGQRFGCNCCGFANEGRQPWRGHVGGCPGHAP